jgi:uncharacterized protein (TIGR03067 family)
MRLPFSRVSIMRATLLLPTLALVSASLALTTAIAGAEAIAPDSDLGRLQGRWTARAGAKHEVRVVLAVQGRRVDASIATPQGIRFQVHGEVKVDETTSPRQLDWVKFTGADQQDFPGIPGIYKLDRDTFTVCNGGLNGTRPTEFKAGDGLLAEVVVFKREPEPVASKTKSVSVKPRNETARK